MCFTLDALTLCSIVVSVAAPAPEKQQEENYEPKNSVVINTPPKKPFSDMNMYLLED